MLSKRRSGFSLMEVMLAIGILLACLVVLGEVAYVGRKTAEDVEQVTTAQLLCQAELNSILAGATPLESSEGREIADAPGWLVSISSESLGKFDMIQLSVTVARDPEFDQLERQGQVQYTLVRWMRPTELPDAGMGEELFRKTTVDTFEAGDLFP